MARVIVVSNRIASPTERTAQPGGLAVALREIMARHGGVWIGWSGKIRPPGDPAPHLSRDGKIAYATLDFSPDEHRTFYLGFANSTLWPLCHYRLGLIEYRREDFQGYLAVNDRFAAALKSLIRPDDLIWIHDYHFIPLGAALRRLGIANRIGYFHHIPFPPYEVLSVIPEFRLLLGHLAAYDLVGVQTASDLRRLEECLGRAGEAEAGPSGKSSPGGPRFGVFPVGIDVAAIAKSAAAGAGASEAIRLRESLGGRRLVLGVDRLDYSKGLPNRMRAFRELLSSRPDHRGHVTFMQIAPVSRGEIDQYRTLRRELERLASSINGRYAEFDWAPVRYLNRSFAQKSLLAFYRVACVGFVTPLRDGMNLVAKEYVASQNPDDPGVLVLSAFAGAVEELGSGALVVNPLDIEAMAEALDQALAMPLEERQARWRAMMAPIRQNAIATWRDRFLEALQLPPSSSTGEEAISASPS